MDNSGQSSPIYKQPLLLLGVAVLLILGGFIFFQAQSQAEASRQKAEVALMRQANIDRDLEYLKAVLQLHQAERGSYPVNTERLKEYALSQTDGDKVFESASKRLSAEYSVRGDYQAYKLTYTDAAGERQTVEGNYKEDYQ